MTWAAAYTPAPAQAALFSLDEVTGRAATPELASYDVILVNISGGKDSQAMLDTVVRLADAAGVRDRVVTVFCDLGDDDEWPGTRELAAEHAAHYSLRHEVVIRTNKDGEVETLFVHIERHGKWPDSSNRYCTSDQKRGPVLKLMTRLADEVRATGVQVPRILNCMGMRAQESPTRAALAAKGKVYCVNAKATGEGYAKVVWDWLPIHALTVDEVWETIRCAGTRPHPIYAEGMPRLSCRFCVLASRSALIRAAQLDPEGARRRADLEERMGHQFRRDLSMQDVIAAATATDRKAPVKDWAA